MVRVMLATLKGSNCEARIGHVVAVGDASFDFLGRNPVGKVSPNAVEERSELASGHVVKLAVRSLAGPFEFVKFALGELHWS